MSDGELSKFEITQLEKIAQKKQLFQSLMEKKKSVNFSSMLILLVIMSLFGFIVTLHIHSHFNRRLKQASFLHSYSRLLYCMQNEFIFLNIPVHEIRLRFDMNGPVANEPPRQKIKNPHETGLTSIDIINECRFNLKSLETAAPSQLLLDSLQESLSALKVTIDSRLISFDRGIQDFVAVGLQLFNLEKESPSPSSSADEQKVLFADFFIEHSLPKFYSTFKTGVEIVILQTLDQISSAVTSRSWIIYLTILICFLAFLGMLVFFELKTVRSLESLIKVFFGFDHRSCLMMKRKCQKLISKIQQTQLDNEEDLFGPQDADQQPLKVKASQQNNQSEDGLGLKRRKAKGSLVNFCTLKPLAAVFYFACSFGFKLYCYSDNVKLFEESVFIYGASFDVSRLRHEYMAVRAWVERDALVSSQTHDSAKASTEDLISTWTGFQKVGLSSIAFQFSVN